MAKGSKVVQLPVAPLAALVRPNVDTHPHLVSHSSHAIEKNGDFRSAHSGGLTIEFVTTERPILGGRNHFMCSSGVYVLAQGPGSLRCYLITQGRGMGSVEILDQLIEIGENGPVEVGPKRTMVRGCPELGQFPLDGSFNHGLVVRLAGSSQAPMITACWMLASDMGIK
jgi:hypothetical protein